MMSESTPNSAESSIPTANVSLDATKAVAPATPAIFTEGELLPWKGRWWKVHLVELPDKPDSRTILLEMLKPTGGALRRSQLAGRSAPSRA